MPGTIKPPPPWLAKSHYLSPIRGIPSKEDASPSSPKKAELMRSRPGLSGRGRRGGGGDWKSVTPPAGWHQSKTPPCHQSLTSAQAVLWGCREKGGEGGRRGLRGLKSRPGSPSASATTAAARRLSSSSVSLPFSVLSDSDALVLQRLPRLAAPTPCPLARCFPCCSAQLPAAGEKLLQQKKAGGGSNLQPPTHCLTQASRKGSWRTWRNGRETRPTAHLPLIGKEIQKHLS